MRWLVIALVACGADPASVDDTSAEEDVCAGAEVVTWDGFAKGFFDTNCQGCHGSAAVDRQGAPVGVTFDTEEQVRAWSDRILASVVGAYAFMPPSGEIPAEDLAQVEIYLSCP